MTLRNKNKIILPIVSSAIFITTLANARTMLESVSPATSKTVFELKHNDDCAWTKHGQLKPFSVKHPAIKRQGKYLYIEFNGGESLSFPAKDIFPQKGTFETVAQRRSDKGGAQDKHHFFTLFNDDHHFFWLRLHGIKMEDMVISPYLKNRNHQQVKYLKMPEDQANGPWRHIALQWDFSNAKKNKIQLFIDGRLVSDQESNFAGIKAKNNSRLYIGSWTDPTGNYASFVMKPYRLSGVRISDGYITDSDKIAVVYDYVERQELKKRLDTLIRSANKLDLSQSEKDNVNKLITKISTCMKSDSLNGDKCKALVQSIDSFEQKAAVNSWLKKYSPYSLAPENDNLKIFWCNSMSKIKTKATNTQPELNKKIILYSAKNEYEAFQLLLLPKKSGSIKIERTPLIGESEQNIISSDNISIHRVGFLKGDIPDPLFSVDDIINLASEQITGLWVSVHTPANAVAGKYTGKIKISTSGSEEAIEISYTLNVWDFSLPKKVSLPTAFGISPFLIKRTKPAGNLDEYIDLLMRHRLSPYFKFSIEVDFELLYTLETGRIPKRRPSEIMCDGVIVPVFKLTPEDNIKIDFSKYGPFTQKLIDKGVDSLFTYPRCWDSVFSSVYAQRWREGKNIRNRSYYMWVFDEKKNNFRWYGIPILSDKYKQVMSSIARQWQTFLKKKNWESMAFNYFLDEPAHWVPNICEIDSQIYGIAKKAAPDIRTFITSAAEEIKNIDIRCVDLSHYGGCPLSKLHKMQKQGTKFWFYTANATSNNSPNMYVYSPAILHRILPWRNWKYKGIGELYWHINYWTAPGRQVREIIEGKTDPKKMDGRLVYPADGKVFSSIRLSVLRDGMEDYEYLVLLKKALKTGRLTSREAVVARQIIAVPIVKNPEEINPDSKLLLTLRMQAGKILNRLYSEK